MVPMTQIWFIAAAVLLLAELLVTTFFMLPFAIGSFFAGLVSLVSDSQNIQLGTFVIFSIVGVYISIKIFGPKKINLVILKISMRVQTNILGSRLFQLPN